ncbi:TerB family tellurite resistance protein [Flavobacterium taihuense]|uniref:TerB family tellurite resistance protein n=1 Tax=Flavobacterium taihuense TaxID=2857508 RepID=A0ABS6Y181_9FLAO|nr:TerB family tellurite resistance protein [Flavobacterium taihuense]MBW4362347.1 TerB family tellurite resistance protein [Flavobacterium taihuense]
MQSILKNLKSVSFLDNKISPQEAKQFPDLISAEVYIDPIPGDIYRRAVSIHKLSKNTKILYFSNKVEESTNGNELITSIVITTTFISIYSTLNKEIESTYFTDIATTLNNKFIYYFINDEDERVGVFENYVPVLRNFDYAPYFAEQIGELIKFYKGKNETLEKLSNLENRYLDYIKTFTDINTLEITKTDFSNQILNIYDKHLIKYGNINIPVDLKYYEYLAYHYKSDHIKALEITNYVIKYNVENLCLWHELKANSLVELGNNYQAIVNYKIASTLSIDSQQKLKFRDIIENLSTLFNENFFTLPYQTRKLILIDNDLNSTPEDTFIVLDKNNLPKSLKFSNNNPKKEELYIVHPYIKDIYMPYSEYETTLFRDKFEEFSYFIQCLGAKTMTIKVAKGNKNSRSNLINLSSYNDNQKSIEGSLGINGIGINGSNKVSNSGEINDNSSQDLINEDETSYSRTQVFNPTKKPHLPADMIWFENESSWQRLYRQRTTGEIKRHHDILSSKSTYSISEKEEITLKEAFANYIGGGASYQMINATGSLNTEKNKKISQLIETTFNKSEAIQWEIDIEFESIENLSENTEIVNSTTSMHGIPVDLEQEYLEEVKFMLEDDGIIDDKERSILERFRERKGISKEKATELEKNLLSFGNLSEDEKEYFEEFQEILNEGEITEKERRILNRMANRLGISEERVQELEKFN